MKLRTSVRRLRRSFRALLRQDLWQGVQIKREKLSLGNDRASWCVCPGGLSTSSVIYSFGVGEEVSFELELIRRFGLCVHAFDPTPRSIEWLRSQRLPGQLLFHPYGVADFDGLARFLPPADPAHVSHTLLVRETPWPAIEVPVLRLATIMKQLGHKRIDLLKMDIEGAEYAVLDDLLASGILLNQLLIEFHHRWPQVGPQKTKRAIRSLNSAGYRIFHVSASGEEYSFSRIADS